MRRLVSMITIFFIIGCLFNSHIFSVKKKLDISKMSLQDLMKIKVTTASKKEERIEDTPAGIVIITREDIKEMGYITINDILQNIPGFYQINDYYWLGSENFGVRGFFSQGVMNDFIILLNGVKQLGDTYSDYSLAKINLAVEAIDRIEIVRGPVSVLYGSGAFLGAINIITNKSDKNIIAATYGTNNSHKLFFRKVYKGDHYRTTINASLDGGNGINVPFSEFTDNLSFLKNTGLEEDAETGRRLSFERKHLDIFLQYDNLSFNINFNETKKGVFDGMPSLNPGTFFNIRSTNINFQYQKEYFNKLTLTAKLTYSAESFYWEYNILKENSYATNHNSSSSNELELNVLYNLKGNNNLLVGIIRHSICSLYRTYDYPIFPEIYTNTRISFPDNIISDALFSQLNWFFSKKLKMTAGIRLEKLNKYYMEKDMAMETPFEEILKEQYINDDIKVIPRLALIYKPWRNHSIKFLYGKAIKQPSPMANSAQMSNGPQLSPAFIQTFELNYMFSPTPFLYTNISVYKNNLEDLIVKRNIFDSDSNTWIINSSNLGKMETKGIEISIKYRPFDNFQFNGSLTYQKTRNLEEHFVDITPGYAPEYLGYFQIRYNYNDIILSLNSRYVDKMETQWDDTPVFDSDGQYVEKGRIGNAVPSYFTSDFNMRKENFLKKGMYINFHIYNIFDQEIRFPTTGGNKWISKGSLDYGRMFVLSVGKTF